LTLPPLAADRATRIFLAGPQKQRLLAVGRAFRVQNQPVSILVTEDFAPVDVGLRRLLLEFSLIACAVLAALLLQRWIVRRGLAPLEEVRPELPKLAHDEISRLSIHAPDEVRPLVAELNRLLELVDQGQRRARHSLGNLAHALKTPLTALTQLTDRPPPAGDAKGWWEDLRQQIRHIGALTERELKRARIGGGGIPGQRVLLAGEVGDLIETLRRIHRDRALHFELRIPPDSAFPGDRDDLLELLGNLLDNACQWASRTVRLTAGTDADG
jgi:signal transduction histidine kinase